jgi:hypothetical protein
MIEAMIPGPEPAVLYQPSERPRNPARKAPATPSSIVMKIPPGSRPGMRNFAIAPTTRPMIRVHRMFIASSSVNRQGQRVGDIYSPLPGGSVRGRT